MKILVVDDEQAQRNILADILIDAGYKVELAENGEQALKKIAAKKYAIVLTDLKMPGKDGLDVLKAVLNCSPETLVIIMTAFGTIPGAVNAIKIGAYDYLAKPFKKDMLLQIIGRASEKFRLREENRKLKEEVSRRYQFANIIGKSPQMCAVFNMIEKISDIDATVLITGHSGTGKELVARAIHFSGRRQQGPFVALNCGAIPESLIESELFGHEKGAFTGAAKTYIGKFEQAQGGTIFLDEIGTMRLDLQIRLLRVLQEMKVGKIGSGNLVNLDVRVIAASNENLDQLVNEKKFRSDLYHRLNVFSINLPSLRERMDDIPLLVHHFLAKYSEKYNKNEMVITPDGLSKLENYSFPGNVRELENIIEKTVVLCEGTTISGAELMLPVLDQNNKIASKTISKSSLTDIEYELIENALKEYSGSIKKAAEKLGISYKTLQYRMKKFNMSKNDFR